MYWCDSNLKLDNRPEDGKSAWDRLKDDYKKENPDVTLMGDKFLKPINSLIIPPKDYDNASSQT